MQSTLTGGQLHVLQYLEFHVSVPQCEKILCEVKYLYVNILSPCNRTIPVPDVECPYNARALLIKYEGRTESHEQQFFVK